MNHDETEGHDDTEIEPLQRLNRDLRRAAAMLSVREVRYLVADYYQLQDSRIRAVGQLRALLDTGQPHELLRWISSNAQMLEGQVKGALLVYAKANFMGRWALSIVGIGPIIAAGLSAHISLDPWHCKKAQASMKVKPCKPEEPCTAQCYRERIETYGHIWRFAGLDPSSRWEAGKKRPWNAALKVLCWKMGESFVKTHNKEHDVYGHLYAWRKTIELAKNDDNVFADQAAEKLCRCKFNKATEAYAWYASGKLPPAHIHARAKRWAVKQFLAAWFTVAYYHKWGTMPPKPYPHVHLGHAHIRGVPNWPF